MDHEHGWGGFTGTLDRRGKRSTDSRRDRCPDSAIDVGQVGERRCGRAARDDELNSVPVQPQR